MLTSLIENSCSSASFIIFILLQMSFFIILKGLVIQSTSDIRDLDIRDFRLQGTMQKVLRVSD